MSKVTNINRTTESGKIYLKFSSTDNVDTVKIGDSTYAKDKISKPIEGVFKIDITNDKKGKDLENTFQFEVNSETYTCYFSKTILAGQIDLFGIDVQAVNDTSDKRLSAMAAFEVDLDKINNETVKDVINELGLGKLKGFAGCDIKYQDNDISKLAFLALNNENSNPTGALAELGIQFKKASILYYEGDKKDPDFTVLIKDMRDNIVQKSSILGISNEDQKQIPGGGSDKRQISETASN